MKYFVIMQGNKFIDVDACGTPENFTYPAKKRMLHKTVDKVLATIDRYNTREYWPGCNRIRGDSVEVPDRPIIQKCWDMTYDPDLWTIHEFELDSGFTVVQFERIHLPGRHL